MRPGDRRRQSSHALLLLAVLTTLGGQADAEEIRMHHDEEHRYSLSLPAGFTSTTETTEPAHLGSYLGPGGLVMSVSRIAYSNLPAWWKNDKDAFFQQVLDGARRSVQGYQHKSQRAQRIDGVPALDLHFAREIEAGKELVWIRFLFHRRFAIVATGSTPSRARRSHQKRARDFTRSLRPYPLDD